MIIWSAHDGPFEAETSFTEPVNVWNRLDLFKLLITVFLDKFGFALVIGPVFWVWVTFSFHWTVTEVVWESLLSCFVGSFFLEPHLSSCICTWGLKYFWFHKIVPHSVARMSDLPCGLAPITVVGMVHCPDLSNTHTVEPLFRGVSGRKGVLSDLA